MSKNSEANKRYWDKIPVEERRRIWRERAKKYKYSSAESRKQWRQSNRHKSQASAHQTQVRERYPEAFKAGNITTGELASWLKENRGKPCTYCKEPGTHIDHKVPLSAGGPHTWDNIRILCEFCNIAKNNYSEEDFLRKILLIAELNKNSLV